MSKVGIHRCREVLLVRTVRPQAFIIAYRRNAGMLACWPAKSQMLVTKTRASQLLEKKACTQIRARHGVRYAAKYVTAAPWTAR